MANILYVDDDEGTLISALSLLRKAGHNVLTARDGAEGLELLAGDTEIHIIFTDFSMSGMDGFEFSKAVRTDPRYAIHKHKPIFGVSTNFPEGKRQYLTRFRPKPIDYSLLDDVSESFNN
jgi:CheY-like chemotaxis protein